MPTEKEKLLTAINQMTCKLEYSNLKSTVYLIYILVLFVFLLTKSIFALANLYI